jgi:hypothetical protein
LDLKEILYRLLNYYEALKIDTFRRNKNAHKRLCKGELKPFIERFSFIYFKILSTVTLARLPVFDNLGRVEACQPYRINYIP